jgi:hypothetical protein
VLTNDEIAVSKLTAMRCLAENDILALAEAIHRLHHRTIGQVQNRICATKVQAQLRALQDRQKSQEKNKTASSTKWVMHNRDQNQCNDTRRRTIAHRIHDKLPDQKR